MNLEKLIKVFCRIRDAIRSALSGARKAKSDFDSSNQPEEKPQTSSDVKVSPEKPDDVVPDDDAQANAKVSPEKPDNAVPDDDAQANAKVSPEKPDNAVPDDDAQANAKVSPEKPDNAVPDDDAQANAKVSPEKPDNAVPDDDAQANAKVSPEKPDNAVPDDDAQANAKVSPEKPDNAVPDDDAQANAKVSPEKPDNAVPDDDAQANAKVSPEKPDNAVPDDDAQANAKVSPEKPDNAVPDDDAQANAKVSPEKPDNAVPDDDAQANAKVSPEKPDNAVPDDDAQANAKVSPEKPDNAVPDDDAQANAKVSPEKPDKEPKNTRKRRPTNSPQNRGGQRGAKQPTPTLEQRLPFNAKPELLCRESSGYMQWQMLLSFPQGKDVDVSQGKARLSPDAKGEYPLLNFSDEVTVRWVKNDKWFSDVEEIKPYPLIFKLSKNWKGSGRKVKYASDGYYMVFAPRHWKRIGNAPVEPSSCIDNKFLAHYFFSGDDDKLDGFAECGSIFLKKRFSLEGQIVADESDHGDLYVGIPPELTDTNNWQNVPWIRAGKEGGGKWGENFHPSKKDLENVLEKREGWFYIRIYDEKNLIDTMDFRYLANLEEIRVNGKSHSSEHIIAPEPGGHTDTIVQFVGDIRVKNANPHIAINNNTAVVGRSPDADITEWTVLGDHGRVNVCVHLPRIWWRLNNAGDETSEWCDTAFKMSRDKFRNNKNAVIIIRVPSSVQKIYVGFNAFDQHTGARSYLASYNDNNYTKQVQFHLRDFCYYTEISEPSSRETALRIQCGEAEFPIVHIPADAPLDTHPPIPPPKKRVLCPITGNKRFSHRELEIAELSIARAKRLGIHVDRRRNTEYPDNITQLQTLREEDHAD